MSGETEVPTCCCVAKKTCCGLFIQLFFVFLVGGVLCLALVPYLIHNEIEEMLTLASPTAGLYQSWRNGTAKKVLIKNVYHFFSIKNLYDVENHGATPDLEIKGPYVYQHMKWRPEDETRWFANGTLQYKSLSVNTYLPEESCTPNEDDTIITPRAGIFIAMQKIAAVDLQDFIVFPAINKTNTTSLFQNRTVRELVHGYSEPVLEYISVNESLGISPIVAFDPDTTDASTVKPSQIYSGAEASKTQPSVPDKSLGDYTMVDGMNKLPYWGSEEANTIRGTDATVYSPLMMLDTNRKLYAYVSDISRSITLVYTGRHTDQDIPVHRYRLDIALFHNETQTPANAGYYITHTGLQPTTPAKNGLTGKAQDPEWIFAAISKAMFLDCDMNGINVKLPRNASIELDDIFLDYEPITSTLLEAHKRLQLNLRLRPIAGVEASKNLPRSWIPVFKFDETAVLPQSDRDTLKNDVLGPLLAVLVVGVIATVIGFFGTVISMWQYCKTPSREQVEENKRNAAAGGAINDRTDSWSPNGRELHYSGDEPTA